jgi:hypothetical protein
MALIWQISILQISLILWSGLQHRITFAEHLWGLRQLVAPERRVAKDKIESIIGLDRGWVGKDWSFVGYKGGSKPVILMMAFVANQVEGHIFVQVASLANPHKLVVDARIVNLLALKGFRLLAKVP